MEAKKIAAMAETYYVAIAPHCPYGPILTGASLQLDACIHNFLIQEYCALGEGILKEPLHLKDGYIEVPKKPGLGIELDEKAIAKRPYHSCDVPLWYHDDGSFALW
jgi:galactonate dehydratase